MWPILKSNIATVTAYIQSDACETDSPLPHKSFYSPSEFTSLQSGEGPLTLEFEIGDVKERRMASPYQIWMLQRIEKAMKDNYTSPEENKTLLTFLEHFTDGPMMLNLKDILSRCPIEKKFEQLFVGKNDNVV